MRNILTLILFIFLIPNLASAKRVGGLFGKGESIKKIMDLEVKGPKGEDLYLAYKTTGYYFIMGAYMSDDGYVLAVKADFGSYYPLDEKQIANYQESGLLPKPLPKYEIPLMEWVWGFALWILLLVIGVIWFFPNKVKITPFEEGCKYYFGKEVPVDYNKARSYFMKSAENEEFAPAQFNLGIIYLNGQGVTKNVQKAIDYFMLASDQNYGNAQFQIGNLYFNGEEIPKNLDRALSFYKSACNNGHQDACKMVDYIKQQNV